MRSLSLGELSAGHPELRIHGDSAARVSDIQYDSRLIQPGGLFVAIRGGHHDGHDYVPDALARGAAAIMVEKSDLANFPTIVSPDSRAWLPLIAARFFNQPSHELGVIGITGTDGKTTTSYLVDAILRDA